MVKGRAAMCRRRSGAAYGRWRVGMTFEEILNQALAMLQRQGRVSYRALKRQFGLDDAYIEDLKFEIIEVHQGAVDQGNTMLVWTGGPPSASAPASAPASPQERE